jgi:3-hydroxyisobutyrate dehydrogenase-like beta-hydroxyacid dehydrogenase
MQVSVIGVGQMGGAIAKRLVAVGYRPVVAYDVDPEKLDKLAIIGVTTAASVEEAAADSDVVLTMVPNDAALKAVTLGPTGILETLPPGGIHVGMSTVSPRISQELAELYRQAGKTYVAATVIGRPDRAQAGKLGVFVAGQPAAKRQVAGILEHLSASIVDLGPRPELANAAKLVANDHIAGTLVNLGQSAALAHACGVRPGEVFRLLRDCGAFGGATWLTYSLAAATHNHKTALFPAELAQKDLDLIGNLAEAVGLRLPLTELASDLLEAAIANGKGRQDWSVVMEELADQCQKATQAA